MNNVVRYRNVSVTIYPVRHRSGKEYYRFDKKNGKQVVRSTVEKARKEAKEYAMSLLRGGIDMNSLTDEQVAICQKFLGADPTMPDTDEFLLWHGRKYPRKNSLAAVKEFLEETLANSGDSKLNYKTLRKHLRFIPDGILNNITVSDLPMGKGSARTRKNRRAAFVTFFKWCVDKDYIRVPYGEKTAAEKLPKPKVLRKTPTTWTPKEMRVLLENVSRAYLPWLVCVAFAGLRTEEIIPQRGSDKEPLDWSDFKWDRNIIIVRAETSKTGHRRVIRISDALRSWLYPIRQPSGRLGPLRPPGSARDAKKNPSETSRLGKLVGGWRKNALRHSFISYRAAEAGSIGTAAGEAGNSESEAKKSYVNAMSEAEGIEWFSILRLENSRPQDADGDNEEHIADENSGADSVAA